MLQTENCFGIWHFLHPHKHIKRIEGRVLMLSYSNSMLVVSLDIPKSTARLKKNEKQLFPPSLPIFQSRGPLKNRLKRRRKKPKTYYQLLYQAPVFHRFSLHLMAFLRKLICMCKNPSSRQVCLSPHLPGKGWQEEWHRGIQKCPREVPVDCIWAGLLQTKLLCSCPKPGVHRNKVSSPSCFIFCLL